MFTLPLRIAIVVASASYGVYELLHGDQLGYLWLAAAVFFVVGYFRYGPIRPAFKALQRGQFKRAERLVATVKFPNLLSGQFRAYFHWIHGVLAAQDDNNFVLAEEQMRLAIDGALRTSNDRCLATAALAQIFAQSDDSERAKQLLADAEQIPHKDSTSTYLKKLKLEFEKVE